jgi:hypothetical protein
MPLRFSSNRLVLLRHILLARITMTARGNGLVSTIWDFSQAGAVHLVPERVLKGLLFRRLEIYAIESDTTNNGAPEAPTGGHRPPPQTLMSLFIGGQVEAGHE